MLHVFIYNSKCWKQSEKYFIFLEKCRRPKKLQNPSIKIWNVMKSSKKYFSSKKNFSTFMQFSFSNFQLEFLLQAMKLQKVSKDSSLGGLGWDVSKRCFQRQSLTKHLRQRNMILWKIVRYRKSLEPSF